MTAGPGSAIGLVGGGQLGRMTAYAARRMGCRVAVLDPDADCPAAAVADRVAAARYDDVAAARAWARGLDVVTVEFENVAAETLAALEAELPVRPNAQVLATCRHRLREKTFLAELGIPVAPFREVRSEADASTAARELGVPAILKSAELGYDGKGQVRIDDPGRAAQAYATLAPALCVMEGFVTFERELSVIVARRPSGEVATYPVFENGHANHILDLTICPARVPDAVAERARELAIRIAEALDVVGLLTVELFHRGDELTVNELAPRPHNSGHVTLEACATSQFENHLRAVCDLPLGSTELVRPGAMANLLGDLWQGGEPSWRNALALPGVHLHLYGKREARPGRKMGHLTVCDSDSSRAAERALAAREILNEA